MEIIQLLLRGVLVWLAVEDLKNQRLPWIGLLLLSGLALASFLMRTGWQKSIMVTTAAAMVAAGWSSHRKHWMGSGDVWVLSTLALAWTMRDYWESIMRAFMLSGLVSAGVWALFQQEKEEVAFVPFVVLGFWIKGW